MIDSVKILDKIGPHSSRYYYYYFFLLHARYFFNSQVASNFARMFKKTSDIQDDRILMYLQISMI